VSHRSPDPGTFHSTLERHPSCVADARAAFSDWLAGAHAPRELCDEMAVVFSELAANASDASASEPGAPEARAWIEGADVVLEVVNAVHGSDAPRDPSDLQDSLRPRGRGLMIARAYTDALDVEAIDGHVLVRCRRHLR
jgi:anti-sigma regulatory factor (Ser/Thr protein kinase)